MDHETAELPVQSGKKKILFIINPVSGGRSSKKIPDKIKSGIDINNFSFFFNLPKEPAMHVCWLQKHLTKKRMLLWLWVAMAP